MPRATLDAARSSACSPRTTAGVSSPRWRSAPTRRRIAPRLAAIDLRGPRRRCAGLVDAGPGGAGRRRHPGAARSGLRPRRPAGRAAGRWSSRRRRAARGRPRCCGRSSRDGRLVSIPAGRSKRLVVLDRCPRSSSPGSATPRDGQPDPRRWHADTAALRRYLVDEGFLERAAGEYWRAGGTVGAVMRALLHYTAGPRLRDLLDELAVTAWSWRGRPRVTACPVRRLGDHLTRVLARARAVTAPR